MRHKLFPYLIALSALTVSGSAAFYSVYGIGKMFAGASSQVMIMAGSLEFAKIVIASLLHQYWQSINKILRTYFMIAVLILIGITSAGIYGFLSSAYQETAFKLENGKQTIQLIEGDKKILQSEIDNLNKQIDDKNRRIVNLSDIRVKQQGTQDNLIGSNKSTKSLNSQIIGIETNIKTLDTELQILNDSLSSKNRQIAAKDVEIMKINSNKDIAQEIGPIKYISEITGKSLATVVNWYIIALMLVFDPLAIALVVAANFAFSKNDRDKKEENPQIHDDNTPTEDQNIADSEPAHINDVPEENAIEDAPDEEAEPDVNQSSEEYSIEEDYNSYEDVHENTPDEPILEEKDPIESEDLNAETPALPGKFIGYKQQIPIEPARSEDPTRLR
jgi:uncharacterized protein YlzI (FlbEa/FlbD family)